jgi:hypothetical protein
MRAWTTGNRVGFWRMLDVLVPQMSAPVAVSTLRSGPFPGNERRHDRCELGPTWHGLYNSRLIYNYTEERERAYWQDFVTHLQAMTASA